jgi:hypothetical protein
VRGRVREWAIVEEVAKRVSREADAMPGRRHARRDARLRKQTNFAGGRRRRARGREERIARGDSVSRIVRTYVAGLLLSLEGRPPPEVDIAPCVATL